MATNTGQFNGNPALLVCAPMLQNVILDDTTGLPMVAGTVTLYQDNSRTTFKNWYYQTGTPGNYTYFTLPNPMVLGPAGNIQDPNGFDVLPFYYPVSEVDNVTPQPYYVTIQNAAATAEYTRQNFPFEPPTGAATNIVPTLDNLLVNNVFWRNVGSLTLPTATASYSSISINSATLYYQTIAPSQHDGFTMPDIIYVKNAVNAVETITFNKFTVDNTLSNNVTPEYYMNLTCTGAGSETVKYVQMPIQLHIQNFSGYTQASASIWVQNGTAQSNNQVTLTIYQFAGTGATTPTALASKTITATNSWVNYSVNFTFPSSANVALGHGGDDAWYLQIGFQPGVTTNINIAKPGVYLSQTQPTNDFQTYDQAAAIFESPRTGDVRISANSFQPWGWVQCNDGVISNANGSIVLPTGIASARANIDTFQLFTSLYNNVNDAFAPVYLQNGTLTTRGSAGTAITAWNNNCQLQLPLMLGRALLGLPPAQSVTYARGTTPTWSTTYGNNAAGVFTAAVSASLLYVGMPVFLTGTMPTSGNFTANTVYYAIPAIDASSTVTFQLATTYANALAGTAIVAGGASDNGSNLVVNWMLASTIGQAKHTQLEKEMSQHRHDGTIPSVSNVGAGMIPVINTNGAGAPTASTNYLPYDPVNATVGMNIIQPATNFNIFMKL